MCKEGFAKSSSEYILEYKLVSPQSAVSLGLSWKLYGVLAIKESDSQSRLQG